MRSSQLDKAQDGVKSRLAALARLVGIENIPVSHAERLISAAGGVAAIYLLFALERGLLGDVGAALVVASMGASAVLLFAIPHGALSQPWAVLVGHGVSAVIGVTVAKLVPETVTAAALAVGLSIGVMHYLRALHPPGGATALTAVIGGAEVHALGLQFVLTPVLLNAVIMVALAVAINAAFAWRRYPAAFRRAVPSPPASAASRDMTHADFTAALARIGTFIDIDEADFVRLMQLTREAADQRRLDPQAIRLGAYYSNGAFGPDWSVRRIVDVDASGTDARIIWRAVAGRSRNETGLASREDFAAWAAHEVVRSESTWVRRDAEAEGLAAAALADVPARG